jgi:hypothetical protein
MLTQPMLGLLLSLALVACASADVQQKERTNPDAATIAQFLKRVDAYVALHKKLEATIPSLPKEATPQQIDQHQRALGRLIAQGRTGAKRGDIFTPGMEQIARKLLADIFRGPGGAQMKREIFEEYEQRDIKPVVNGRYPDEIPLSTVPPQVLAGLPKLPDEQLQYRFVGTNLILLDPHAHIIADFVERAIP